MKRKLGMTIRLLCAAMCMLCCVACGSDNEPEVQETAEAPETSDTNEVASYVAHTYIYGNVTMPYRERLFNQTENNDASSLVILLHGGSQRGNDNEAQLNGLAREAVQNYIETNKIKVAFLLPQCATDRVWNEASTEGNVVMTEVLYHWITDYVASHNINNKRIYLLGYSAGGSGTWRMVNDFPDMFAAAMPVAAKALMVEADNMKTTPLYVAAGQDDKLMDVNVIKAWVAQLTTLGCTLQFDILAGADHQTTCETAFTAERLSWIFGKTR